MSTEVDTVRVTIRQFGKSLGLKRSGLDYLGTTVLMKMLCKRKIARKVGKVTPKKGRPSLVYEVPVKFTLESK